MTLPTKGDLDRVAEEIERRGREGLVATVTNASDVRALIAGCWRALELEAVLRDLSLAVFGVRGGPEPDVYADADRLCELHDRVTRALAGKDQP